MAVVTKLTVRDIQLALHNSEFCNAHNDLICPNVSWGLLPYEADLIAVSPAGICTEFEIKRSFEDFKADFKKDHKHDAAIVGKFYYVVPESLQERVVKYLIEQYPFMNYPAVLTYDEQGRIRRVLAESGEVFGRAERKNAIKMCAEDKVKLGRLISLRYWDDRVAVNTMKNREANNERFFNELIRKHTKQIKVLEHRIYDNWNHVDNILPADRREVLARTWSGKLFLAWNDKGEWRCSEREHLWIQYWIDVPCYTDGSMPLIDLYK